MTTTAKKTAASPAKKATASKRAASGDSEPEKDAKDPALETGTSNESIDRPREAPEEGAEYEVIRPIVIEGEQRMAGDKVKLSSADASELVSHGYVRKT